jgi:hypothetical protein
VTYIREGVQEGWGLERLIDGMRPSRWFQLPPSQIFDDNATYLQNLMF